jgi:hypothetical protein
MLATTALAMQNNYGGTNSQIFNGPVTVNDYSITIVNPETGNSVETTFYDLQKTLNAKPELKGYVRVKREGKGPANFRLTPHRFGANKDDFVYEIPEGTILPYFNQIMTSEYDPDNRRDDVTLWFYVEYRGVLGFVAGGLLEVIE